MTSSDLSRRRFLELSALALGSAGLDGPSPSGASSNGRVALVVSPDDRLASAAPARWALAQLRQALTARGIAVSDVETLEDARASVRILVAAHDAANAAPYLKRAGVAPLAGPEATALLPLAVEGGPVVLACGGGVRGLEYALLELAERVEYAGDPLRVLAATAPVREEPFSAVRAIGRPFVSDVEDKPWFNDRTFWPGGAVATATPIGRWPRAATSGALYVVYQKTGSGEALEASARLYRQAREVWAAFAREAGAVYAADITFGPLPHQRGHWQDRLAAIDADIAAMGKTLATKAAGEHPRDVAPAQVRSAVAAVLDPPARQAAICRHTPPDRFVRGAALRLSLAVEAPAAPSRVRVLYRHVNQAERYEVAEMRMENGAHAAVIPAVYTDSRFPLQYYFELRKGRDQAWLFPGLNRDLTNQPYFVVRQRT